MRTVLQGGRSFFVINLKEDTVCRKVKDVFKYSDEEDTVVTLYESGKVVFQGVSADIEASLWTSIEKDKDNKVVFKGIKGIDNDCSMGTPDIEKGQKIQQSKHVLPQRLTE